MKWLLGLSLVLCGCASSTKMQASERAKIKSISIVSAVKMPDEPQFIGTFMGVLGDDKSQLKQHMDKVGFDLPTVLKQQFRAQAERQAFFKGKFANNGNYKLELEVRVYGLVMGNAMLSKNCTGLLTVVAKMYDAAGNVVWQKMDHADRGQLPTFTSDEFMNGDAALKASFGKAAQLVANVLINDFMTAN